MCELYQIKKLNKIYNEKVKIDEYHVRYYILIITRNIYKDENVNI